MRSLNCIVFVLVGFSCASASAYWSSLIRSADFFLYNKHRKEIYYSLSIGNNIPGKFHRVAVKRWTQHIPLALGKETHLFVSVGKEPSFGDKVDHYVFHPGGFRFVHIKIMEPFLARTEQEAMLERLVDDEHEVVRDEYLMRVRTTHNPTVVSEKVAKRMRRRSFEVTRMEYVPTPAAYQPEVERQKELEEMNIDELEQELIRVAMLLSVVTARGKKDGDQNERLRSEQHYIRRLLAQLYPR
ncbi:hypothetical protein KC460_03700 [Candidatus Dependentiae bacterium]|nr:hypothetical protein [Candidatus Dependentiae bacterium]